MNDQDDPNLVTSGKSQRVVIDGYSFLINIYRLETDTTWSLEVVDHQNDSQVWDNQFETDSEARDAALAALNSEGQSPSCAVTTWCSSCDPKPKWPQNTAYLGAQVTHHMLQTVITASLMPWIFFFSLEQCVTSIFDRTASPSTTK